MQLEFQCRKCDESFAVTFVELSAVPELACPGCSARATDEQVEALTGALEELFGAVASLRKKFAIEGELDGDDLPPPFDSAPAGRGKKAAALEDDEDEDDEEEDDEEEDDDR